MPSGVYERKHPAWNKGLNGIHFSAKSEFKKGMVPWNKGNHVRLSDAGFTKGHVPWNKGKKGVMPTPWNKGEKIDRTKYPHLGHHAEHTEEAKAKMSAALLGKYRGDRSWHWQGGKTPLVRLIRNHAKNAEWKLKVLERDEFKCQQCLEKGGRLHAHHATYFSELLNDFLVLHSCLSPINDCTELFALALEYEPFWDVNNGITLCEKCHLYSQHHWKASSTSGAETHTITIYATSLR